VAGSDRMSVRRAARLVAPLALIVSMSDCGEFVRTNPHDPLVPVTVTIEGPDSSFAQFDTLHFTVKTDPVFDHETPVWSGSIEKLDNAGTFRTPAIDAGPTRAQITVRVGTRTATKIVDFTYRPKSFKVRNCYDASHSLRMTALQDTAFVCSALFDAHGGRIDENSSVALGPITARALDPTVVQPGASNGKIVSVRNGTTPVVFTSVGLPDTLTVTVQQEVAFVTVSPATCVQDYVIVLPVGATLQLGLSAPAYDLTHHLVTDPAVVQQGIAEIEWFADADPYDVISVTRGGLVKALSVGYTVAIAAVPTRGYSGNFPGYCLIRVK
jgi:hypothetical protein